MLHNSTHQLKKNTIAVVFRLQGNCQLAKRGMLRSEALNGSLSELRWSVTASQRSLVVGS